MQQKIYVWNLVKHFGDINEDEMKFIYIVNFLIKDSQTVIHWSEMFLLHFLFCLFSIVIQMSHRRTVF